jgi:hypothetical protein
MNNKEVRRERMFEISTAIGTVKELVNDKGTDFIGGFLRPEEHAEINNTLERMKDLIFAAYTNRQYGTLEEEVKA